MEKSEELKKITLRIYDAMGKGEQAFALNTFSQQEGVLSIGSDPKEWWDDYTTIAKVFKAQLEEMKGIKIQDADPQAFSEGTVGWMADNPKIKLPDGTEVPFRITGVFHQENNDWKVVQWHASIGVSNEEVVGQELTVE